MPKDKRSFFERLTGTISVSEDKEFNQPTEVKKKDKEEDSWVEEEGELAVDVFQTNNEIIIQAMIAGVKPEDLNIAITREMVTIKGRRDKGYRVNEEDCFQKELYWGAFSRTILLPAEIETDEAEAIEKYGLLIIRLPKIDKNKTQHLKVKSA